ncbi:MAG TPA: TonB family protein [Pyrinomonadaceae bacterium]|nr:TonB family protein [Pyrinomonadaceae bacterium]
MLKRTNLMLSAVLLVFSFGVSSAYARGGFAPSFVSQTQTANDREQDGLAGPVRRVKTETAKITTKNGKPFEGPRVVLETATYDIKGGKVDHAYFLAAGGALTGKEVYKYDDKGNIVEMTLHHADGTLLTKEVYSYEFDQMGNWTKMVTAVAVIEGGKMTFEPTEVTYRTLSYFLDEAMMAKMAQPAATNAAKPPASANANTAVSNTPTSNPAVASATQPSNAAAASSMARVGASPASGAPVVGSKPVEKAAEKTSSASVAKETGNNASQGVQKLAAAPPPVASVDRMNTTAPSNQASSAKAATSAPVVSADGEAPARPVARGPVKPVSGGILNGKAVKLPAPEYPEVARRQRTMGMVTVEVVVDVTGRVISAKAVGGPIILQSAAEKAALAARFSPTLLSGQPVKVSGQITYNFTIQ